MAGLMKCNSCGKTYPSNLSFCLNDGSPLVQEDTLVGTVLDGRYRLDSLIGVGGMGDVYRATHLHLDTEFAVKLLKPEFVANQTAIKRFRLEAKAAGRIHHPNAVRVTDFGVMAERTVYLVMELVQGHSLRSLILKEGKLDYLRTVNIVLQVCGAVDAAHRSGVIHRDLKPDNILIEMIHNTERIKVLDFGIAKLKETKTDAFLTQAGTIIGTPQYMSPEQCQGKHLDPPSDIYSIGIILYEMLSGQVPFDGDTTLQVVYNQLHATPRHLREIAPETPEAVSQVVMRSLEKDPEHRQSSALELSDELRAAVDSIGMGGSLSMTNPLTVRPIGTTGARKIYRETPSLEEEGGSPFSIDEELTAPFDRKTAVMGLSNSENIPTPVHVDLEASTLPDDKALAPIPPSSLKRWTRETPTEIRRGIYIIGLAAIILAAVIGLYLYLREPTKPVVDEKPRVGAPEGMVFIEGGKFTMGRNDGSSDEGPAHEVEIKSFFLDAQEVTNQEYKKFVDATGRPAPKNWTFNGSYVPDEARLPVTHVTWDDATAYAKWAKKRLPTEAEWEFAARGGAKALLYPWGNQWQPGYANVDRKDQRKPSPGRSFERDVSPFGVYDMAGNVSEWVQDAYTERYGAAPDQRFRVYRGGNFLDSPEKSTNTYRWADFPTEIPDDQILRVGFRCAKEVE